MHAVVRGGRGGIGAIKSKITFCSVPRGTKWCKRCKRAVLDISHCSSPDEMSRLASEQLPSTTSAILSVFIFLSFHSAGVLSRNQQGQQSDETFGPQAQEPTPVDVIVYGSTPSGIAAAVAASRAGRTAAIVDPSPVIGGMITGGLSCSDTGNASVIGELTDVDVTFRTCISLHTVQCILAAVCHSLPHHAVGAACRF